jgi:hypothetical protein
MLEIMAKNAEECAPALQMESDPLDQVHFYLHIRHAWFVLKTKHISPGQTPAAGETLFHIAI